MGDFSHQQPKFLQPDAHGDGRDEELFREGPSDTVKCFLNALRPIMSRDAARNPGHFDEWVFDRDGAAYSVAVSGPLRSTSLIVAREGALAGMGIARVPYHFAGPELESGRLVRLLRDYERQEAAVYAIFPAQREMALKTRAFIDFLVAEVGSVRL